MAKIVARQIVPGSQELVWHVLSDFGRTSEWVPSAVSIEHTDGPAKGLGREHTVRYDSGLEAHQRIVAWDDSRRLAWRTEREMHDGRDVSKFNNVRTTVDLRPSGPNTEITVTRTWSGGGPLGLIRSFSQKATVKREFEELLANLNSIMNNDTGSAS